MSDVNLNRPVGGMEEPERFDLGKHVHEQKPFITGAKMLVSVVVATAALGASALGGAYLLVSGEVPEFAKKAEEKTPDGDRNALTPAQQKTFQTEVDELFQSYQAGWNSGKFPVSLATSDFASTDNVGKTSTSTADVYSSGSRIQGVKVAALTQVSDDEASAVVRELSRYGTDMKAWFMNAGGSSVPGGLTVDRVVEYEYRLVKSGGWKIKSRKWLRQSPALIQQAGENGLSIPFEEGTVAFEDKRPSKESLDKYYQEIVKDYTDTDPSLSATFAPGGRYTMAYESGDTVDYQEIANRLSNLKKWASGLTVKFAIESVDQTGPLSAEATVRYEGTFTPSDSQTGNGYVAVWRDRDTWMRATDTSEDWTRVKTLRVLESPILHHYEMKPRPLGLSNGE